MSKQNNSKPQGIPKSIPGDKIIIKGQVPNMKNPPPPPPKKK